MRPSVVQDIFGDYLTGELHGAHPILGELRKVASFDFFCYVLRTSVPISCPRAAVFCNYPDSWIRRYKESNYAKVDPVMHFRGGAGDHLRWNGPGSPNASRFLADARDHGLSGGVTFLFPGTAGVVALVSLARRSGDFTDEEIRRLRIALFTVEGQLKDVFYQPLAKKISFFPSVSLSGREQDVLKYTADGKKAEEIAELLHVATTTVNFHVQNAISKLEAKNKTEAAIKAALWGLI